jgi:hypothetical protein
MKHLKTTILFCAILTLASARPAAAGYVSAAELQRACLSDKKAAMSACVHYVAGVIDYHFLMQSLGTTPTIDFCLPANLSIEKAAVKVMQYLRSSPQQDGFIAAASIPLALNHAYPCAPPPKKKTKKRKKR